MRYNFSIQQYLYLLKKIMSLIKKTFRIIPKLDIKNGLLVKGINLEGLRVLGLPSNFSKKYYLDNADEIIYLDAVASNYGTNSLNKFVTETAKNLFIPLIVGGGIRSLAEIQRILESGADKICINSAAIENISIIKDASKKYGSSTIISIIETVKIDNDYFIAKSNGRDLSKINPIDWAKKLEDNGAGEILLTSVNNEGLQKGFDLDLIAKISKKACIPVVANGGAGNFNDIYKLAKNTNADGVAISSLFHYSTYKLFPMIKTTIGNLEFLKSKNSYKINKNIIKDLKKFLIKKKINIRP